MYLTDKLIESTITKLIESENIKNKYIIKYKNQFIADNFDIKDTLFFNSKRYAYKFNKKEDALEFIKDIPFKFKIFIFNIITEQQPIKNLDLNDLQIISIENKLIYNKDQLTGYKDKNNCEIKVGDILTGTIKHNTFRGDIILHDFIVMQNKNTNKYYLKNLDKYDFIIKGMSNAKNLEIKKEV